MIEFIKGRLCHTGQDHVVVENNGMGYKIFTSSSSSSDFNTLGNEVIVYTEMIVREDSITLVGFSTKEELTMFRLLTSVSGIGTKVGIGILSSINYVSLSGIISSKDVKMLTNANGVGKKTAERIILELKDKVGESIHISPEHSVGIHAIAGGNEADALEALITLGYTKSEATAVVKRIDCNSLGVEDIIRLALKELMMQ